MFLEIGSCGRYAQLFMLMKLRRQANQALGDRKDIDTDLDTITGLYRPVKRQLHFNTRRWSLPSFDAECSQTHGLIQYRRGHASMKRAKGIAHPVRGFALKHNATSINRKHLKRKHIANGAGRNLMKGCDPCFNFLPCHSSRTPASSQIATVS